MSFFLAIKTINISCKSGGGGGGGGGNKDNNDDNGGDGDGSNSDGVSSIKERRE